ncbi:MAG: DUF4105 domain-containing protein [Halioglobus sp.]
MTKRRLLIILFTLVFILLGYLSLQSAVNDGPWKPEQATTAVAKLNGRTLTIKNIRDFRYSKNGNRVIEENYLEQSYSLDELERIWFGLSHFGPYGLAHSFLSFEFSDGEYLVLSVEARQRPQQNYNPLLGLMREYTKIYVMATERDVVAVRSHQRGERVLLYPVIDSKGPSSEAFLLALIDDMNALDANAEFYNTILDNCLTNLLKHTVSIENISVTDYRILLPGHTDRLTYGLGTTPNDIPFEEARQRATVDPDRSRPGEPNFSQQLRCGWQGYQGLKLPGCAQ